MDKKLPRVFANTINKKIENNKNVFYGGREEHKKKEEVKETKISFSDKLNIKQKLVEIFKSDYYVYKINVEITLKDRKITKRIIGYNDKDIITMENELIPIHDIQDIVIKLNK
jgi:hypothetical protein